jgi:TonB family protein
MRCWHATFVLLLAFVLATRAALAQPSAPPPQDETPSGNAVPSGASGAVIVPPKPEEAPTPATITPPVLKHFENAEYPPEALHAGLQGSVVLVLDIDATGAVTSATVPAPAGHGFDEAAIVAAKKFVFAPAQRDGKPIGARIKYQYNFTLKAGPRPPTAPQRTLEGRVVSAQNNAPIAVAQVTVRDPGGAEHVTLTAADGTWSFLDLPPGSYHLVVAAGGFLTQAADEDIVNGKATAITFRLAAQASSADVTIRGERPPREVTRITLEESEIERIPGTMGDALRSLQNLPGVARPPGLAGILVVRGTAPADTQIFVDGTPIPIVYHFGGLSSVVPTEILNRIDFYPSNFSAEYGRAEGAIVDVGIRDAGTGSLHGISMSDNKLHGMAQVDLIDARVVVEGPIVPGSGWNFMVAGRRSYVDVWLKPLLTATGAEVSTAPVYYDYQAMIDKQWSKNQSLRFFFFGSDDRLALLVKSVDASDPALGGGLSSHQGFVRFQARYRNKFSENTELKITAAGGEDFTDLTLGGDFLTLKQFPVTLRSEFTDRLEKTITLNLGVDLLYGPFAADARLPPFNAIGQPPSGPFLSRPPLETNTTGVQNLPGTYAEFELTPWSGGRLVPGMRLDYSSTSGKWDLAPRVVARQDLTSGFPRTTLKAGVGLFFQPPQPQQVDPVFGQPGLRDERATQYDVGVEQEFTKYIDARVDGFYTQLADLVSPGYYNEGRGQVIGAETMIRYKPDKRFFGWLAYTLSRSTRQDPPDFITRLSTFDQTHILTVLGSYRLGGGWEFGARFRLVSGNLYTPNQYGFYDENAGSFLASPAYPPNGSRLPIFHQLDMRVDKIWQFKHWRLNAYLDVQNVYNRANVEGVSYNFNYTAQTYATGLPLLPDLGLRGEF